MGKFLDRERIRQTAIKQSLPYFSAEARQDGIYRKKSRSFCLPKSVARENLLADIRDEACNYFQNHQIGWHDGTIDTPSNHLCSSQVCCVNFLFPFMNRPQELRDLLRPIFPALHKMLPLETPESYLAFEWIGLENYLGEKTRSATMRTRGANFTSADAMVMFEHSGGLRQIVLIEWKYTESYPPQCKRFAASGTDRGAIYAPLFDRDDCPIDKSILPNYDALFYEPFYQLMRQQLLAHEMELAREFDADIVSLLHIAPAQNTDFQKVTSPALKAIGKTVTEVWDKLTAPTKRFAHVSTESLFGTFPINQYTALTSWWDYIHQRYSWLNESTHDSATS